VETCPTCGAKLSAAIEWCGQCYTPTRRQPDERVIVVPEAETAAPPRALAPPERILYSALLIAFVVVAFAALVPEIDRIGSTTWGVVTLFLGSIIGLSLVALWIAWRPTPSEREEPAAAQDASEPEAEAQSESDRDPERTAPMAPPATAKVRDLLERLARGEVSVDEVAAKLDETRRDL